eukprot:TRINITY_DN1812_c0_g1_i1.p1 TRINITY_DN1812_c0_g1~~TRINITY_DN1812_c0_g1_i1.p1  ORF type:complete len:612 (+),score=108.47 TRINITY_DN1812_c0_g1_i1:225-1838(+)
MKESPSPSHCCEVDECGDLFGAHIMVQLDDAAKTLTTIYNSRSQRPSSPKKQVNSFLSKYPNGTRQVCYHPVGRPLDSLLDKDSLCFGRGEFNITSGICKCYSGWVGDHCQNEKEDPSVSATIVRYYIAAEEIIWDYAPSGMDNVTQMMLNESLRPMHQPQTWVENDPSLNRIGKVYHKARYVAYTDDTFTTRVLPDDRWIHLGILGPAIHAAVGETIRIVFRNKATRAYSMHPHGVHYTKTNEGAAYAGQAPSDGNLVAPGETYTYTWTVPDRAGPGPNDPSSIVWFYHSHVDEGQDTNTGLVGPIIICRAGAQDWSGKAKDVDREFVTFFSIFDETRNWYLKDNIRDYLHRNVSSMEMMELQMDKDFIFTSFKHSINGYLYGNVPGFNMQVGERVRWYVMSLGTENDIHAAHWHGSTLLWQGARVDSIEMIPGTTKTLDMVVDTEGTWLFHCHTNHHIHGGMTGLFHVKPCTKKGGCTSKQEAVNTPPVKEEGLTTWPFITAAVLVTCFASAGLVLVLWLRKKRQGTYHSVEMAE